MTKNYDVKTIAVQMRADAAAKIRDGVGDHSISSIISFSTTA